MTDICLVRPDATLHGTRMGNGRAILLLHAGGEDRRVWTPVAASICAEGFTSIAYDLRGHGDSDSGPACDLTSFAGDVAAMIDALPNGVVVVGASLGGLAALLTLADPRMQALVAGFVLVDVVPDPPWQQTKHFLRETLGDRADEPLVDDILARAAQLRLIAAGLRLPTLLLHGASSPVTADDVERLRNLVPTLMVAVIPRSGHLIARDAPSALAAAVVRFANAEDVAARHRRIASH